MTKLHHWITYYRTIAFSNLLKNITKHTFHLITALSTKISVKPITISFRDTATAGTLAGQFSWGIQAIQTLTMARNMKKLFCKFLLSSFAVPIKCSCSSLKIK